MKIVFGKLLFLVFSLLQIVQCRPQSRVNLGSRNNPVGGFRPIINNVRNQGKKCFSTHCSKSSFFVQKFNFDFPRKWWIFLGWKTRKNVVVLDSLAVDNFDFTRKIVKKIWLKNLWKCWGFVSKLNFWTKIWLFH